MSIRKYYDLYLAENLGIDTKFCGGSTEMSHGLGQMSHGLGKTRGGSTDF